MCLFPLPNLNFTSLAYKKGVRQFDCGACPECLRKRSSSWVLRSVYESREHIYNCMVTLTYDNFEYDDKGRIVGELPVNPDLKVKQRDIQLFIKRLRKWCSTFSDEKIKYIACAEYGSRTHRAHYHLILFGVNFPDLHYYKKSKRGNVIYMSDVLTRLWGRGICTVDSIRVFSSIARYCTKYCAKSRSDDTFMLCSQGIGFNGLWKDFNGISYFIDGREYPIPRFIWEYYIMQKYSYLNNGMSPKYVNFNHDLFFDEDYEKSKINRSIYRSVRDSDDVYSNYLSYWSSRGFIFERLQLPVRERILHLDDSKFHNYKIAALECYDKRKRLGSEFAIAPGSGCIARYVKAFWCRGLPLVSRPNMASDTELKFYIPKNYFSFKKFHFNIREIIDNSPIFSYQISFFS